MSAKAFNEAFPNGIQTYEDAVRYLTHFHGYVFQPGEDPEKVTFSSQYVNFTVSPDKVLDMARQYFSDGQREAEEVQSALPQAVVAPVAESSTSRYYLIMAAVVLVLLALGYLAFRFFTGA
jgi:hypothetical protein